MGGLGGSGRRNRENLAASLRVKLSRAVEDLSPEVEPKGRVPGASPASTALPELSAARDSRSLMTPALTL